jgi:hypothetical protein
MPLDAGVARSPCRHIRSRHRRRHLFGLRLDQGYDIGTGGIVTPAQMPQLSMVLRRAAFGSDTKILAAPAAYAHRMLAPIGPRHYQHRLPAYATDRPRTGDGGGPSSPLLVAD